MLFFSKTGSVQATSGTVVSDPHSQSVLINKTYQLPSDYVPAPLVTPDVAFADDTEQLHASAADALEAMFADATEAGIALRAASGYRSYDYQKDLHAYYVNQYGASYANQISAEAGHSEHQTGLAIDVTSPAVNNQLTERFAATNAGQWVKAHAADYGFIIRYPQGKEQITGYSYEPWHLRYIGTETASHIMNNQLTLEAYFSEEPSTQTYMIQPGDTLGEIALQYEGVTVQHLLTLNPDIDPYYLQIGTEIILREENDSNEDSNNNNTPDYNKTYKIQAGDTLWDIAQNYSDVTVNDLLHANKGINPAFLSINQTITIPTAANHSDDNQNPTTYTIQPGDTLWEIARGYPGVSINDIQAANPAISPRLLMIGSTLTIPD